MATLCIYPASYTVGGQCTISASFIKQFVASQFYIPWYSSAESNKVFPIILSEMGDLTPSKESLPSALGALGLVTRNPFFDHTDITYLIARSDGVPVGRVAAYRDRNYNQAHGHEFGWLGLFECIESKEVARSLLNVAMDYLRDMGCTTVIGPAKFNANGEVGLLVDGFSRRPYLMEPYNPPYYQQFFEMLGFVKDTDWYSFVVSRTEETMVYLDRISQLQEKLKRGTGERARFAQELNIRSISLKDIAKETEILRSVYNTEWGKGNHPQFVKMTDPEFDALVKALKDVAVEDWILVAEHAGKPVGVSVFLPNINEVIAEHDRSHSPHPSPCVYHPRDIWRDMSIFMDIRKRMKTKEFSTLRGLILGVSEEYRGRGIESLLYYDTFMKAGDTVKAASGSEVADINIDMVRPLQKMGGEQAMTWRVYKRGLR